MSENNFLISKISRLLQISKIIILDIRNKVLYFTLLCMFEIAIADIWKTISDI